MNLWDIYLLLKRYGLDPEWDESGNVVVRRKP